MGVIYKKAKYLKIQLSIRGGENKKGSGKASLVKK
jgi:hypothetical protein